MSADESYEDVVAGDADNKGGIMIRLTRLDGSEMYINPDLIEIIEETPDTHLTLSNGNRYLVLEPVRVIVDRIMVMQAKVLRRSIANASRSYLKRRNAENYRPVCMLEINRDF